MVGLCLGFKFFGRESFEPGKVGDMLRSYPILMVQDDEIGDDFLRGDTAQVPRE